MSSAPSSPDSSTAATGLLSRPWIVGGLLGVALVLFARNPAVILHPQFWHEDALVFLTQQRAEGIAALAMPYAGQLYLFQRLVAFGAGLLPLELTPPVYLGCAFAAWLAAAWVAITSPLFRTPRWAVAAALAFVAIPHGGEVFTNLTNAHWPLIAGLALILAERPGSRPLFPPLVLVSLAGLSGPGAILLTPIALWRWRSAHQTGGRWDPIALATLSLAIVQLAVLATASSRIGSLAQLDGIRPLVYLAIEFFPELLGTKAQFPADLPWRVMGTLLGIVGLFFAARPAIPDFTPRRLLLAGGVLALGAGLFAYLAEYRGVPRAFEGGQRYLVVPFALYLWALLAAASHTTALTRLQIALLVGIFAATGWHAAHRFVAPRYPAADWAAVCRSLAAGQPASIHVAPFNTPVVILPE